MSKHRRFGFTLIELLVVIGIIAALAALLIPMAIKASRQASKIRAKADLQTISTALTAYKGDFGDIPRPDYTAGAGVVGSANGSLASSSGAALLCKALLGPGNAQYASSDTQFVSGTEYKAGDFVVSSGGSASYICLKDTNVDPSTDSQHQNWTPFWVYDGADGPGSKARVGGKTSGYLVPEQIGHHGMALTDHNGGVVLYFPANPANVNVNTATAIAGNGGPYMAYADFPPSTPNPPLHGSPSKFNLGDNFEYFRRLVPSAETDTVVRNRMRMELGDYDANGYINDNETPASVPYVLITPGSDGVYGPAGLTIPATVNAADAKIYRDAFIKCDDATNLDFGQ